MTPPSGLLRLCVLGLALSTPTLASGGPELCVMKPLSPPDFSGEFHLPVPSLGCVGNCLTPDDQEVHAIRLSTKFGGFHSPQARAKATLNVRTPNDGSSYGKKVVLLLVGSSPVDWTIKAFGDFDDDADFQIIVSSGSEVVTTGLEAATVTSQPDRGRLALLKYMVDQFGCVTSFTDVTVADLVELTLGTNASWPKVCNPERLRPSPGLSAFLRQPIDMSGCYHRHLAGIGARDVYVIEVTEQGRSFSDSDVTIQLAPVNCTQNISANITLLLKATMPVTWTLETERFSGDVLVVTEDPVVSSSLDPTAVSLSVRTTKLPATFSDLLIHTVVGYSSGPPVAYVRSLAVHRIVIGLPDVARAGRRSSSADSRGKGPPSRRVPKPSEKRPPDNERHMNRPRQTGVRLIPPSGALRRSLSVSCELGRLVVAVPAAEADLWHVNSLNLADPTCRSFRNSTYLVISQPLDACLTRRRVVGGNAVYDNTVHFVSSGAPPDDEDFDGSGSGMGQMELWDDTDAEGSADEDRTDGGCVPVSCTHPGRAPPPAAPQPAPTNTPLQQTEEEDMSEDAADSAGYSLPSQTEEEDMSEDAADSAGYSLDLFSDELLSSPIRPNAPVPATHTIYVRASVHILSAPDLRPVVEQCWISQSSNADAPYKFLVVRAACPVGGGVTFRRSGVADVDIFTLQVTRQYLDLGPYFLHCRVGLCARPFSSMSLRIAQCLNRLRYCTEAGGGDVDRRVASEVRVVTRGPLLPNATGLSSVPGWQLGPSPGQRSGQVSASQPTNQQPLPRLGVEPETVAGVGVAAFVLGLTLMGGVWLIHSRIGPSKRRRFQPVPQNPPQEVSGQSAHSTPSSQTPIII